MTQPPKYAQKYIVENNCLFESFPGKNGIVKRKLCNLAPEIVCEITVDDGAVTTTYVRLRGVHESGRILPEIEIPAADLASFNWMAERWGMDCILEVGKTVKDCVRHAIQTTAAHAEKKTVFAVTGWKKIGEEWYYLMPGDDNHTVDLHGKLQGYSMERKYDRFDIQTAACLLRMMPVPEEIMFPLLAFTFLSPLNHFLKEAGCEPKFILFLSGKTGSRKSTLAALMLSFFGKFTASELPLSFRDTANSILHNAFALKDVLTCIDDLHPSSRMEEQKMNGTAQAIMRAYGDRTGKGRLRSDSTLMESRPPQGNAIITAEFAPDIGVSGTARYFALELKESDVDLQNLTSYQREAARGTLQRCMYAYTQWIKETFLHSEEAKQEWVRFLNSYFLSCREEFRKSSIRCHGRVPEAVAHLQMGMDFFLLFLKENQVMDEESNAEIQQRFREILYRLAARQAESIDQDKPTHKFIRKLYALLESNQAYADDKNNPGELGFGTCLGYQDDTFLYLHSELCHKVVRKFCEEQGENFSCTHKSLLKAMAEEGLILPGKEQNTRPLRVGNKQKRVIFLYREKAERIRDAAS